MAISSLNIFFGNFKDFDSNWPWFNLFIIVVLKRSQLLATYRFPVISLKIVPARPHFLFWQKFERGLTWTWVRRSALKGLSVWKSLNLFLDKLFPPVYLVFYCYFQKFKPESICNWSFQFLSHHGTEFLSIRTVGETWK